MAKRVPYVGEEWRFKPNRGAGRFVVVRVARGRVTLRDALGYRKVKSVSLRTLHGDYERVP